VEIRFLNSVPAGSPSPIFEITVCKPTGVLFELSLQPSPFNAVDILKSYLTVFSSRKYSFCSEVFINIIYEITANSY
jgi:hypothetical protein